MKRRQFLEKSGKGLAGIIAGIPLISGCSKKNPVAPLTSDDRYGELFIKTEKDIYVWQLDESAKIIYIYSALENSSTNIYYSKLGDGFNAASEQDPLFIAGNSAGYLEKYNEVDNSWNEINILGGLIEGSNFVSIKPSRLYSIHADLFIKKDEEEKGEYRFRIDYYDSVNPDVNVLPFKDYSNTFKIIDIIK